MSRATTLEQDVGLPRDPVGLRDLRQAGDHLLEALLGRLGVAGERELDEDPQREAGDVGVDRAAMPATTPEAFSRRRRCIVAVGDRPTSRASSTFVRSASRWSSSQELTSSSSS